MWRFLELKNIDMKVVKGFLYSIEKELEKEDIRLTKKLIERGIGATLHRQFQIEIGNEDNFDTTYKY